VPKTRGIDVRGAVISWIITLCYMGSIFFISSKSNIDIPALTINFDKVLHACAYMVLAFLSYISLNKSGINKYAFIIALLFASIYGITDEFHQSFVPGRDSSIGDVIADFSGAMIGCIGATLGKHRMKLF
jgi:VanZ family protein